MNLADRELIAQGATADVYAWDADRILKLFHPNFPADVIQREYVNAHAVASAGVRTPDAHELLEFDGRQRHRLCACLRRDGRYPAPTASPSAARSTCARWPRPWLLCTVLALTWTSGRCRGLRRADSARARPRRCGESASDRAFEPPAAGRFGRSRRLSLPQCHDRPRRRGHHRLAGCPARPSAR